MDYGVLPGPAGSRVPLAQYLAAAPDPLWRKAPAILGHLDRGHRAQLLACVRAHGLREPMRMLLACRCLALPDRAAR